jgi:hypothetical protein
LFLYRPPHPFHRPTPPPSEGAVRAGWGAVLGRAVAAGVKMGVGIVLVVIGVFAALRS